MHGYRVTSTSARISQRVVDGNTSTHEWSRFLGWNFVWDNCNRGCWCNHVFSIAAIEVDTRDSSINAHCEISTATSFTDEVMPTVPTNSDALTDSECVDIVA
jgi:hypothetical protein